MNLEDSAITFLFYIHPFFTDLYHVSSMFVLLWCTEFRPSAGNLLAQRTQMWNWKYGEKIKRIWGLDMTCTISCCHSEGKVKMFHYSYDEEIQDYVCIGTIITCEKHAREISKNNNKKLTVYWCSIIENLVILKQFIYCLVTVNFVFIDWSPLWTD